MNAKILFGILVLTLGLFGCDLFNDAGTPIARVKDRTLTLEDLRSQGITRRDSMMKKVVEWVEQEVLYQEALAMGLQNDHEVAWLLHDAERKILLDAYRNRFEKMMPDPEDGALEAYFDRHRAQFVRQEPLIQCQISRFKSLADARQALKDRRVPSDSVSDSLSWHPLSSLGACIGGIQATLGIGQLSIPQACDSSFVVVQVRGRKPVGSPLSFSEARDQVQIRVLEARKAHKLDSLLTEAKSRQAVFTWPNNLPSH